MPQTLSTQRIPLAHIDFTNTDYALLPYQDETDEDLVTNIKLHGILHPPIIRQQKDRAAVIISGRKRLLTLKEHLKKTSCNCLVAKNIKEKDALVLALQESLLSPPLSCIQKAIFLQKITTFMAAEEAAELFLPLWKQAPQLYYVKQYLQIAALEEPISKSVHSGIIGEKTALQLSAISFRDRFSLFETITTLHLSISNQRKIIKLCTDLARRHETSVHALLTSSEIADILQNSPDNLQQTTDQLMKHLNQLHTPNLSHAKTMFNSFKNKLKLPKWANIEHSPSFEQDSVTLKLTLKNQQEAEKYWQGICKIKNQQ